MKNKLKKPCSILIFDSNENNVEFIKYPTSLDYTFMVFLLKIVLM